MKRSCFWFLERNDPCARAGLTLVEVMVTVTILAIVAVGVGATFISGVNLWGRVKDADSIISGSLLDLEVIARDLRQSVNVPSIGYEGKPGGFSFPAVEKGEVVRVTYSVDVSAGAVTRRVQMLKSIMAGDNADGDAVRAVLSARQVTFQYLTVEGQTQAWAAEWPVDKGIFKAIRLEGVINSGPFSKIITIPVFTESAGAGV